MFVFRTFKAKSQCYGLTRYLTELFKTLKYSQTKYHSADQISFVKIVTAINWNQKVSQDEERCTVFCRSMFHVFLGQTWIQCSIFESSTLSLHWRLLFSTIIIGILATMASQHAVYSLFQSPRLSQVTCKTLLTIFVRGVALPNDGKAIS